MSDKKTLLAVSGGIDSMCMAEIFVRRYPCECLAVAHCNFRLRGEESDGDEELVRLWAEEHGIRFHVRTFDTREYAADHGVSIEMAARELRYRWFAELCAAEGYDEVAVAHNANDNAETLMLNLLRGSGIKGLTGMSPVSDIPYSEGASAKLIRPLLDMTRKQIEGFALANRIRYRNDSTNFSSEYKRNMLRNEVFPIFERINPSFIRTLNREMGYLSESEEIVSDYCQKEIAAISSDALSRHPEERSDVTISCPENIGAISFTISLNLTDSIPLPWLLWRIFCLLTEPSRASALRLMNIWYLQRGTDFALSGRLPALPAMI